MIFQGGFKLPCPPYRHTLLPGRRNIRQFHGWILKSLFGRMGEGVRGQGVLKKLFFGHGGHKNLPRETIVVNASRSGGRVGGYTSISDDNYSHLRFSGWAPGTPPPPSGSVHFCRLHVSLRCLKCWTDQRTDEVIGILLALP